MSKGFLILASNTTSVNYVEQAYALAVSIKRTQKEVTSVSIVTNDILPESYASVFDYIIPLDQGTENTRFAVNGRWRLFHVTPYDETIVLDSDMIMLTDVSYWWKYCERFELLFCSKIKNYLGDTVTDTVYRKTFIENNLPNPYFGLHYFKKRDISLAFYKQLKFIVKNWTECCNRFAPESKQSIPSMDLASAIAIKTLAIEDEVFDNLSPLVFTHMKPAIQNWGLNSQPWPDLTTPHINNNGDFLVSNIKQTGLFHYVEKDFLTPPLIMQIEELLHEV